MNKWLNELQEGDRLLLTAMIQQVNKGVTSKGAPYLSLILQDKSGIMDAKYWNVSEAVLDMFVNGMIVDVQGDVLCHNKQLQFRVSNMKKHEGETDLRDFVKSSPIPVEQMKTTIEEIIASVQHDALRMVTSTILKEYEEIFYNYPAAAKNHHAFVGGLATHILGMLALADNICSLYDMLNRDLLICGVILHDVGKLIELSGPIVTEYTVEGKLLGHISIMQAKISSVAEQLQLQDEEVVLLRHMVLSHHGVYEYGSPVLPMIPEAEVLYLIDNLDARMDTLKQAFANVQEGSFTPRIFALENRNFYKAKK